MPESLKMDVKDKINRYREITKEALEQAKENISDEKAAKEIIEMVEAYMADAEHFEEKGEDLDALAALSYAHGWLDCGARLKVFDVSDSRLFTV